jgi:hypothetical protein
VFLQQVWGVADTGTLCSLLRTSRAVGELAHANCEGRVDVRCYKDSLQFSEWLHRNKQLLHSLDVSLPGDYLNPGARPVAESALASALSGRSAGPTERSLRRTADQLRAAAESTAAAAVTARSAAPGAI